MRDYKLYHYTTLKAGYHSDYAASANRIVTRLTHMSLRRVVVRDNGDLYVYDIPADDKLRDFKIWAQGAFAKPGYCGARIEGCRGDYTANHN